MAVDATAIFLLWRKMHHQFEKEGVYYLFDTESNSLHIIDKTTFDILENNDLSGYSKEEIAECNAALEELRKGGMLDAPEIKVELHEENIVKALCLHICHDCNLRCKYCFAHDGTYMTDRAYMSLDVGKKAIDFLIKNSGNRHNLEIDYFGGEPLMNFDVVKEITVYAREQAKIFNKAFKFTMTTNCLLLSDDTITWLNENMDNVVLSIDGRREVHDKLRVTANGKGSFDIAVENAIKFRRVRGNKDYYVRGTFTRNNLDFYKDVVELRNKGFDQISIEPVVLPSDDPISLREEDLPQIFSSYDELSKIYTLYRKKDDTWFNFFHFMIELDAGPCIYKRIKGCGAGVEYFAVTPQGNIFPCHQFADKPEFKVGDVFTGTIDKSITKRFLESNLMTKAECRNCWAKYYCGGGCAANNYNYSGDIDKPYKLACEMYRKRLECSIACYCEEQVNLDR